jgi:hypothetical protein
MEGGGSKKGPMISSATTHICLATEGLPSSFYATASGFSNRKQKAKRYFFVSPPVGSLLTRLATVDYDLSSTKHHEMYRYARKKQ